MPRLTSHWELDGDLVFATPDSGTLAVRGIDLAVDRQDGVLSEVRLTFSVPVEEYGRIDRNALFHLGPHLRGPGAERFHPEGDVQIEARLDSSMLPGFALMGDDILVTGPAFAALAKGSPLLETESWYALHVTVEVMRDAEGGSLREGFSTLHAAGDDFLSLPMLAIAAAALEEREMDWQETSDDEVIRSDVPGENGVWACFIVGRQKDSRCTVYSQAPWETPENQRMAMAELITRINFGLPMGNFELDFGDGEVRFKTSIDVSGTHLSPELFDDLLEPNLATMDLYLPALEAVRDGRMTPEAAVATVEE
ncbi:MAG: YbjN domain-containing protein [Dehalococcoidia bacterium]